MALGSGDSKPPTPTSATGAKSSEKQRKPAALNLSVNTKVEAPQPSAALTSLKTSRFLTIKESLDPSIYLGSIASPNPALNAAVGKRGQAFKYDAQFLLQFQKVFTEQPSVEFSTQVKQLIGDSDGNRSAQARTPATAGGRQNSRTNSGFPGNMPAFGNFSSQPRTLPPGTTSETRFAQSQAQQIGRPPMGSGAMSFGPGGGSFPRSNLVGQMARQPSNSGIMGPNSPRQGSRAGRGGSQKSGYNTKESKDAKSMPLTQGIDVKALSTSTTGWKPSSIGKSAAQSGDPYMDPKLVQRKVQAALNKMTPENFDRISDQILNIANQSKVEKDGRTLRQVIQLTFEKATDEPHFSSTYAKFCKRMLDQMSADIKDDTILDKHGNVVSGGNLFRKYLLNRCQEEFEKGWSVTTAADDSKEAAAVLLSDEYYVNATVKRRGLGLVRFIGELYKLGMLTERIITGCIHGLIDFKDEPKEAEIESLCFLMRTVGQQLEATEKGQPMMQVYFERIQKMIDLPNLESRLKFMLMDVRDLRNHGWQSKEANKGPKTLNEIRAESEANAIARQQEAARSNFRGGVGGGRGGGGRGGDNRAFSAGYNNQASNTVGMDDLRRLKSGSRPIGAMTLGPHSMLASRSNSGRRGGPGGLGRTGEDSGMSSRTGTPPSHAASSSNAYGYVVFASFSLSRTRG
jgi:translation initiation factor 4G